MPKYTQDKIGGYYLYFTSKCIVEAMHVHASDDKLTEVGSAKIWVGEHGETKIASQGRVSNKSMSLILEYIHNNYKEMYKRWEMLSSTGFYEKF